MEQQKRPTLFGGDLNFIPSLLARAGFAQKMGLDIVAADDLIGSCASATGTAMLDYYMMSTDFARGIKEVKVDHGADTSPHKPVRMTFFGDLASAKFLGIMQPQALPRERPFGNIGPQQAGPEWENEMRICQAAPESAKHDDQHTASQRFAYKTWANTAERELMAYTDATLKKAGVGGRGLAYKWKPLMEATSVRVKRECPHLAPSQLRWLRSKAATLSALASG